MLRIRIRILLFSFEIKVSRNRTGAVSGFLPGGGRDIFRGWRKSPRGWRFFAFLHTIFLIYSCYKEIHKIYIFLFFFLFVSIFFYASLVPLNVLGLGGSKHLLMVSGWRRHPMKCSEGGEMGLATPLKSPLSPIMN